MYGYIHKGAPKYLPGQMMESRMDEVVLRIPSDVPTSIEVSRLGLATTAIAATIVGLSPLWIPAGIRWLKNWHIRKVAKMAATRVTRFAASASISLKDRKIKKMVKAAMASPKMAHEVEMRKNLYRAVRDDAAKQKVMEELANVVSDYIIDRLKYAYGLQGQMDPLSRVLHVAGRAVEKGGVFL